MSRFNFVLSTFQLIFLYSAVILEDKSRRGFILSTRVIVS